MEKKPPVKTRLYVAWFRIFSRCTNPQWHDYYSAGGGVGVTISADWHLFENFKRDMGEIPEGKKLYRINCLEGYSKENCMWATLRNIAQNRCTTRLIEYQGRKQTISAWSRELGLDLNIVAARMRQGMTLERVFSLTPLNRVRRATPLSSPQSGSGCKA